MVPTFDEIVKISPIEIREILDQCENTPQSPKWHPEGNVLKHIRIVYNRARKTEDINFALAAFFHDLGKSTTTKLNNKGGWSSIGHEHASEKILLRHSDWIINLGGNIETIRGIVINHMRIKLMDEMRPVKRKELMANPYYELLLTFSQFDNMTTLTQEELSQ